MSDVPCPRCGSHETHYRTKRRDWVCDDCEHTWTAVAGSGPAASLSPEGGGTLAHLLPRLPHPLAVVLKEYADEPHPCIKLHRLCDALEMLVRFLTSMALAEVNRAVPGGLPQAPERLRQTILANIEAPTFGKWVALLREGLAALPKDDRLLAPEMRKLASSAMGLIGGNEDNPGAKVLALRNQLAHDRLPEALAQQHMEEHGHRQRFEGLWLGSSAKFLGDLELVGCGSQGKCFTLMGAALPPAGSFPPRDPARPSGLLQTLEPRSVWLTRKGSKDWLRLTPLQIFGAVLLRREDQAQAPDPEVNAAQIYSRSGEFAPRYTALHRSLASGDADEELCQAFEALFPLKAWRREIEEQEKREAQASQTKAAAQPYRFRDIVERFQTEPFVGREGHLREALAWLDGHESGVGLILGHPGMGKSAFVSHLSVVIARERKEWLCLRHFFKVDDKRCLRHRFLSGVLYQLADRGLFFDREGKRAEPDPAKLSDKELTEEFHRTLQGVFGEEREPAVECKRLVLLLDGLDEIAQLDRDFVKDLGRIRFPKVMLLCTGRPVPDVEESLPDAAAERLSFTCLRSRAGQEPMKETVPGLPPLDRRAVREFLLSSLERQRYALLREEQEIDRFLDHLTTRVEGSPLYLKLLAEDLRRGAVDVEKPHELPADLPAYYDRLLERMQLDAARSVLQPYIAFLAVAHTPLPESTLKALFAEHSLSRDRNWDRLFGGALRLGHALTRKGYVWEGQSGHTLYHQSFREHLLKMVGQDYERAAMAPEIRGARARLAEFCREWRKWPEGSYEREYALRYGPRHLVEWAQLAQEVEEQNARWDAAVEVLCDLDFIEAKSRAGMVNELAADCGLVEDYLPEAQLEKDREREQDDRVARWTKEIVDYARKWSEARDRHAQDPEKRPLPKAEEIPLPEPPPSVEPWSEERIKAECQRIARNPTRLDRLRAFRAFVGNHMVALARGEAPVFQLAYNSADGGPVAQAGQRYITERKVARPWIRLRNRPQYNPKPACLRTLEGHTYWVEAVALTADGRRAVSASDDLTLRVWDVETGVCLRTLEGHTNRVCAVALTPDGRKAVSGGLDKTLRVWDVETGVCLRTLEGHAIGGTYLALTPDGRRAVSGGWDKTLRVWDVETGKCLRTLEGHAENVWSVALTPDGRRAVSGSSDNTLRVWDVETGACLRTLEGHAIGGTYLALTPDGRKAVSGGFEKTLRVCDVETGKSLRTLEGHTDWVNAVALTPDGRRAVSGSFDHTLRVWDVETGACLRTLEGHAVGGTYLALTPDGRKAVSGGLDKTLRVWDLETGAGLRTLEGYTGSVSDVALTPDGRRAVSGGWDNTLRVWDMETGKRLRTLEGHTESVRAVTLMPDGRRVVSGSRDKTLRVWDVETGKCLRTLEGHTDLVFAVALTPDGHRAVSGSADNTLRIWDLAAGACLRTLEGHTEEVHAVALTPDGRRAVSGSEDKTLRVWDVETGACLRTLEGHTGLVCAVAVTPDGRRAVSGSRDDTLRVWDVETGACLLTLEGHTSYVSDIALTPDGRKAVSPTWGWTFQVWDVETGACLRTLEGHTSSVSDVALTPDGRRAVSGGRDKTLRVWDLEKGTPLGCHHSYGGQINKVQLHHLIIAATTDSDRIEFLELVNLPPSGVPLLTAVRLWLFGENGAQGRWDCKLTVQCYWCGRRFALEEPLRLGQEITCPLDGCGRPLKLNPFACDNRGRY